jgi:hypothetical protein
MDETAVTLTKDETIRLQAEEIERLQQMTKDAAQALNDEERENERLRELLRESFEGLDEYWVTTPEGVSWILRVNDVFGDE